MAATGESCEMTTDGQFTARGLRPGTYLLEATPSLEGPDNRAPGYERGFAIVNIKDADVGGVVIPTAPGVTVRGRVRFEESRPGSMPPPLIVVQAALAVTEWQGPSESANVSEDGTFELHDVRGPRVFRFEWQLADRRSYWIPGPILLDGQDITNVPVDFSREPAGDLVVVFRQRASAIVGRVEDIAGLPASGCVAMLPEDPDFSAGGPPPSAAWKRAGEGASTSPTCPRATISWRRWTATVVRRQTSWSATPAKSRAGRPVSR